MINRIATLQCTSHNLQPLAVAVDSSVKCSIKRAFPATALALILASPGFANAATFQVTNTNDAGPGSLRQAVLDANTNSEADEIVFEASVSGTVNLVSGPMVVEDSVTISGPGANALSIDGGGNSDIFEVSRSTTVSPLELNLSGLRLTNATTAISADVGDINTVLTLTDSTITGNQEYGIYTYSYAFPQTVNIRNSELSANGRGAVMISGTSYSWGSELKIEDTVISNNDGTAVSGVVLSMDIVGSEIRHNGSGLRSIGIWPDRENDINVENSVIADNEGHGIYHNGWGRVALKNTSVSGNGESGVHVYSLDSRADIHSSTISDNGNSGVDFRNRVGGGLSIINTTISGNHTGYGVRLDFDGDYRLIENSTITDNEMGGVVDVRVSNIANEVHETQIDVGNSVIARNGASGGSDFSGADILTVHLHHSLVQNPGNANIIESVPNSNIFSTPPLLGPLQDNGGPTQTHALLPGSPAIDQGDNATCRGVDQRGITRPRDGDADNIAVCDMGAFELSATSGTGSIGDRVWKDLDGDGTQDANEPGLGGVVVNLRENCDPGTLLTTITDSTGAFRFDGLAVGSYQLEFVKPAGYTFSPTIAAGNYEMDSNADPSTGLDQCRTLSAGQNRLALDAGLIPDISGGSGIIGDFVWRDDNGDGVQDSNEPGLQGVTVNLRVSCAPNNLISTTTDSNGAFRFEGLPADNYRLEFIKPDGYSFSPLIAAGDYTKDSNADPSTGLDQCRTLKEGQIRLGLDAGLMLP